MIIPEASVGLMTDHWYLAALTPDLTNPLSLVTSYYHYSTLLYGVSPSTEYILQSSIQQNTVYRTVSPVSCL